MFGEQSGPRDVGIPAAEANGAPGPLLFEQASLGRRAAVAAAGPAENTPADRLTVDASRQIPRRPAGLRLRRGVVYGAGLRLDLLTPPAAGRHPLVVYLPGGGFVVAPRAMARRERGFIAAAGYAVASVAYRTTRQHATYADGLGDIQSAVGHLIGHADEYGIDPNRVGVWGESAGGYLASLTGLSDPRIRAVVDQFGASDLSHAADGFDRRMHAALANPRVTRSTDTAPPAPTRSTWSGPAPPRSCSCTATMTASSRPRRPWRCTKPCARRAPTARATCWPAPGTAGWHAAAGKPGSGPPCRS